MDEKILKTIQAIYPTVVSLRRKIHQNPELSFCETMTANTVKQFLEQRGISYRDQIAKTGVLAEIRGKQPGKTLLIRADMDAIPQLEESGVPFCSQNSGAMHACGHDAHTAILLGTACVLNEIKDQLKGTVKLAFQPGEEESGGALPMIQEGILENPKVDACIALHLSPLANTGDILIKEGEITASPDDFEIKIIGKGGHGASPQDTIDPIAIGCQIVTALQTIPCRRVDPNIPSVLSIGYFQAGSFQNSIPDTAKIGGTFRTTNSEVRRRVPQIIESIIGHYTKSVGASYEFEYHYLFPPANNDESLTKKFIASASRTVGAEHILRQEHPYMIGEDFAYFGQYAPSLLFHLGCRNEALGAVYPLHSPRFLIDEACMETGMRLFAQFALDFLSDSL